MNRIELNLNVIPKCDLVANNKASPDILTGTGKNILLYIF